MKTSVCPLCETEIRVRLIAENKHAFAIFDKYPVNPGHVLVIPKRHCEGYFDLKEKELADCWHLINDAKQIIETLFTPDGYNIGINVGEHAGQTIFHVHLHLIPRYKGDVQDPLGGVRGVVPERRKY